ncbi:MAG: hypothetical protein ACJ74Q_15115 [Pyrinomonadaceae bacterium]
MHVKEKTPHAETRKRTAGEGAQVTLYGDIKPDPVTTATFLKPDPPLLIPAYGIGVDSTSVLVKLKRLGIRPALILTADAGLEWPETYAYLPVINEWLRGVDFPEVTIVRKRSPQVCDITLEDELTRLGLLPAIAYGKGSCSAKWKISGQEYFLNHWEPALREWKRGRKIVRAIGYEANECNRVDEASTYQKSNPSRKFDYWHPLVEWNDSRADCIQTIKDEGLPLPPKSACWLCSSSKKHEIERLARVHPDLFLRALLVERIAEPKNIKVKGLGRNFAWKSLPCAAPFHEELDWIMEERERARQAGFIPLTRGARIIHGVTPPASAEEWPVAA